MISLVTLTYKAADHAERMLESLFAHRPEIDFEVVLVDNGPEGNNHALKARFPEVKQVKLEKNFGFAGGCNAGIAETTGEYVVLVNPDVVFTEDAITAIVEYMDAHPQVAVSGIRLRNMDGSQQQCVARFPRPTDQLLLLLKIPHIFPNLRPMNRWLARDFDYSVTQPVDQVMGAFFCIRREVLNTVGWLDDGYFIWYEEVDYCKQVRGAGWEVMYVSEIEANHVGGSSFARIGTRTKQAVVRRSIRRYMKKHYGHAVWLVFVVLDPIFVCMGWFASLVKKR